MRWKPRSATSVAAVTTLFTTAGLVVGIGPAAADIGAELPYLCTTSSGSHKVGLRVKASTPISGTVGEPVQLGTIHLALEVPTAMVSDVLAPQPSGAPNPGEQGGPVVGDVAGTAQLDVNVLHAGRTMKAGWPLFALAAQPSGGDDKVTRLVGTGVAPPVLPSARGDLTWAGGELALTLTPSAGTATQQIPVRCAPKKEVGLGTVTVQGRSAAPDAAGQDPPATRQPPAASDPECQEIPAPGIDPEYSINLDKKLYEIFDKPGRPAPVARSPEVGYGDGLPFCARAAGFANIKKLGNAVPVAAHTRFRRSVVNYRGSPITTGPNYLEQQGYVVNFASPTTATMLSLGFMPTTATAQAVQVRAPRGSAGDPLGRMTGNMRVNATVAPASSRPPAIDSNDIWVRSYVAMKVGDVAINGTPLKMGSACRSGRTLLDLHSFMGDTKTGILNPDEGQTLSGDLSIPAFANCGIGEDLSPLLTASISGNGNYVKIESGPWCRPGVSIDCNANLEEPQTWSITPGGDIIATAKPFVIPGSAGAEIRCETATMKFHLDRQRWRERFKLAEVTPRFTDCKLKNSAGESKFEVTADTTWWMRGKPIVDGPVPLDLSGVFINAVGDFGGQSCTIRIANYPTSDRSQETPGAISGEYDNKSHTFSVKPSGLRVTAKTTCPASSGFRHPATVGAPTANYVFDPPQKITKN